MSMNTTWPIMLLGSLNGLLPWRLWLQNSANITLQEKRHKLENEVDLIAKQLEVTKPLALIEVQNLGITAQALGNNLFSGPAGFAVHPDFKYFNRAERKFIMAHEISHVKHNDLITFYLVPALVFPITNVALSILFPVLADTILGGDSIASYISLATAALAFCRFSQRREECADKTALSVCSEEEKKAASKFFQREQKHNRKWRDEEGLNPLAGLIRKLWVAPNGDSRLDLLHPSLSQRIQYVEEYEPVGLKRH